MKPSSNLNEVRSPREKVKDRQKPKFLKYNEDNQEIRWWFDNGKMRSSPVICSILSFLLWTTCRPPAERQTTYLNQSTNPSMD